MLRIEANVYSFWQDFELVLDIDLNFLPGNVYRLVGRNGSGKSTFITQMLLPRLSKRKDLYLIYSEQQMQSQLQAIKAYAGVFLPRREVNSESEAYSYLAESLTLSRETDERPSFIILDEPLQSADVLSQTFAIDNQCCLIYSSHQELLKPSQIITFESLLPNRSKVYAHST
jgi:ABC-type dipeptide/oligopeptide/nickel transport system ATPase subunit